MQIVRLTGVCRHEGEAVVSKCPERDVASCGDSVEEAMVNLREAVELFLKNAQEL
ncbi:MAG: type II toxin-antitoxin system HicB family antitoxin [Bryobacteraceae bacterium]|jgi:predicted RNase H-like HicB family nuclease